MIRIKYGSECESWVSVDAASFRLISGGFGCANELELVAESRTVLGIFVFRYILVTDLWRLFLHEYKL